MLFNLVVFNIVSEYIYVIDKKTQKKYSCKAKGLFRHNNQKITVGDIVDIQLIPENSDLSYEAVISKIHARKNELKRPRVANIDQVVIVTSILEPKINYKLLLKEIMICETMKIDIVLLFTKIDLATEKDLKDIKDVFRNTNYNLVFINNNLQTSNNNLIPYLNSKFSIFMGQTGAGKSSTLNNILGEDLIKTQEISKALNRGKHTTTDIKSYIFKDFIIADSPGFSSFKITDIEKEHFANLLQIFNKLSSNCKFRNCLHINEPNCFVKKNIDIEFSNKLYENYIEIYNEVYNEK